MQPRRANDWELDAPAHAAPRAFVLSGCAAEPLESETVRDKDASSATKWNGRRRRWLNHMFVGGGGLVALRDVRSGWAGEPNNKWPHEVMAGQFHVHADFELSTSQELLGELDRLSGDVTKLLELQLPTKTMHIVLFSGQEEYRRYMAHYYPALPERRALFIQQRGTSMLFAHRHPELATDLRHEAVHALLNEGSNPLPLWLDEGLAEYFEVPEAQRWSGHNHVPAIRALAGRSAWRDLDALEALHDVARMSGEHYRDSWAWVHFLLHRRPATRRILVEHLASLRAGQPVAPLSRAVAAQLPTWRDEFSQHFQQLA